MRTIASGMFMSLDGVVQADDDWQFAYFDDELFASITAAWDGADTAVMGRRSYEGYRSLREHHLDSPMLGFLDGVDRYVLSTTMSDPQWPGTTVLSTDPFARLEELRNHSGADILVAGSPSVVRELLVRKMLDQLNVTVLPIVVGHGDRLFPESSDGLFDRLRLELHSSRVLGSGAIESSYRPVR
ncbi:pyrimidine reductase [Rhodococcoides trifolii]|uniref:Pyrimidine reductase n=1 Tax=Rhodococcoides trifolii TaxID=908250 RepID=A0A917G1G5_9NOCA|nr:dihydrofolate reductase family protein [Rhodococcus trifolii]GGG18124.1 pyrimidine reductase [Rhodococcus trifolii]